MVEERKEVAVRCQLQVLIAQFRDYPREVEQVVVVVKRRRVEGDLHARAPLIDAGSTIWTSTGLPLCNDWTPASQTAAAAYPSHASGPSTLTPAWIASTQRWNSVS